MRIQTLVVGALLTLPMTLNAQVIPRRGTAPDPSPLPPAMGPVDRALAVYRSRWSAEGYTLISAMEVPDANGNMSRYATFGTGTHAGYRVTDQFSATMDMAASFFGGPAVTVGVEAGTRFSPVPFDHGTRPYVDLRASYMYMFDSFSNPSGTSGLPGGLTEQLAAGTRYGRGLGGVAGVGVEHSITSTLSLSTEMLALRDRMTTSTLTNTARLPAGTNYWMTSLRWTLGIKFTPASTLHLAQNPRQ